VRHLRVVLLLALTSLFCLAAIGTATAAPGDPFQFKFSFETAAVGGIENPTNIAVNHETGNVLVFERGRIVQFGPGGKPANFSGLGEPSFSPGGGDVMIVDNSGGPTQGNIYVLETFGFGFGGFVYWAFGPDGKPLASNPIQFDDGSWTRIIQAGAVGPDGKLWLISWNFAGDGNYYAQAVTPTGADIGSPVPIANNGAFTSVMDELGHYFYSGPESYGRYAPETFVTEGETGLPLGEALAVDPSTNDVYSRQGSKIQGVGYSDPLVKGTPFTAIDKLAGAGPFAFDATGQWLYISEGTRISAYHREPAAAPTVSPVEVDGIRSTRAQVHGEVSENGAASSYHFEYGLDTGYGGSTPEVSLPFSYFPVKVEAPLEGLQPDTTYHVRLVATNGLGTTFGPDHAFKTYAVQTSGTDSCPNALARKQTAAQRLPDCRAYERVSALDTGGYDVESYLAPGQTPYPGFPAAKDRLLYATHSGAVPGPWNATNKGPDPYLATRTAEGWTTEYKGLPADLNPAAGSFSSVLGEADAALTTLAFAGPDLCRPCFTGGGLETGIPVRMPDGELIQGMTGSLDPGVDSAEPEGRVEKMLSDDGRHLVFASKYAFEPGANTSGDLTVYDRDLVAGTTQIVSTDPSGATLCGAGISELDISGDGSRIVIGKRIATDGAGNEYVHPYMHLGSSPNSVDLAPLTTSGVLFAGMTADGSRVFFTSSDQLLPGEDTDHDADLYEAEVDSGGALHLALVSAGPSPVACDPVGNDEFAHWNTPGGGANCDAVAVGGGNGVASSSGVVYFLSPEQLDGGAGTLNQPNLYRAAPGADPTFVATLESDNPLVLDSVDAAAARRTGDFQTTPSGNFAAFVSALELTGVNTFDVLDVFRYDAGSGQLVCASCDTTGTSDAGLAEDAALAPDGLSLLEDGRLFFTSRLALVLNDANSRKDVYQWADGEQKLITTGTGPFDTGLLTASADGIDVFFFTHEPLAPEEDNDGFLMRVYDAREGGGFFKLPAPVPCQASDECHGPGTVPAPPPDIRSAGPTTQGNFLTCRKGQVKRAGKCVKKHHKKKHHKKQQGNKKQAKGKQGKGKRHA
jgi:hypothetical protein